MKACVCVQARCLANGGEEPGTPAHERVLEIIGARVRSPLHHAVIYPASPWHATFKFLKSQSPAHFVVPGSGWAALCMLCWVGVSRRPPACVCGAHRACSCIRDSPCWAALTGLAVRAAQPVPQDGLAGRAAVPHGRLAALRQQRRRAQQPGPGPLAEGPGAPSQHHVPDIRVARIPSL